MRQKARTERGIFEVLEEEVDDYTKCLSDVCGRLKQQRVAPVMPCQPGVPPSGALGGTSAVSAATRPRPHQERIAPVGYVSDEWYALTHTPHSYQRRLADAQG